MRSRVPAVEGVVTAEQVLATARSIARTQLPSGAVPWFEGGHVDPWDHVQGAMGLSAAGLTREAERAYAWSRDTQRPDGSWPARTDGEVVTDSYTDANFCAYLATGVWHHWRVTGDRRFVEALWPTVERGIERALAHQRPDGAIAWTAGKDGALAEALVTGNASIHLSLRCAVALADLVGSARPDWELAAARLRHALDEHPEAFEHKPTHAMDWYYPVLGGAMDRVAARARLDARWSEFDVPERGCRCVSTNPWVTGAETCELALALDVVGRPDAARRQLAAMQHLRHDDGAYWTGLVYDVDVRWPVELSTWTSATVVLAADALSRTTPASGLFRGEDLPACAWRDETEETHACPFPTHR